MNFLDMLEMCKSKSTSTEIRETSGKFIKQLESDEYSLPFDPKREILFAPKGDFQNGGEYLGDVIFPHIDKNDEA